MNTERLLAEYHRIADAPVAIPRLRRFVLDLAVRGKLVPQESQEQPALKFDPAPLSKSRPPFDIPPSWHWARLHTLGKMKGGGTPSKLRDDYWDGAIPWVSPKDMKVDHLTEAQMSISDAAIAGSAASLVEAGSVLFVVRGMILAHSFPVAVARVSLAINQDMKALVLKKPEMAEFILRALKGLTSEMLKRVQRSTHGTCRLEGSDYSDFLIPIPPWAEQERIVAKVDELMKLCDRLAAARAEREAARDRLAAASLARLDAPDPDPATFSHNAHFALTNLAALTTRPDQIKQLRQTILNLAVRGKLVRQDPNDEPASELLKRIAGEVRSYAKEHRVSRTEAAPIDETALPFSLPMGWTWTRLASLFNVITDGDHLPPPRADDGVAFLTIGNVTTGALDFSGCRQVPPEYFGALAAYRTPGRGDLLYTVVGATYGRPVIVDTDRPFCVQRHIAILKPPNSMNVKFMYCMLRSPFVYEQATRSTTGSAQPTIGLGLFRNFLVPLPPSAEQQRIVAKVDTMMALCDSLAASLAAGDATRGRLLDTLIAEALEPAAADAREAA